VHRDWNSHGLVLLEGSGDYPASLGIERERALTSPAGVAASAIGLNRVRQLERIGVLLKDAVDLRRVAFAIDAQRIEAFGRQPRDQLGDEIERPA
jgi:hypothetical protein